MKALWLIPLFVYSTCLGQTTETHSLGSRAYFGINAAPNFSWMSGPDQPSYTTSATPGLGYRVGATVLYGITSHFSLEFAPGYVFEKSSSQTSHQLSDGTPASDQFSVRYTFSWLEMPFLVNYAILSKGDFSWYAGVGISLRYRTSSREEISTILGNGFTVEGTYDASKGDWLCSPTIQMGTKFSLSSQSKLDLRISYQRSVNQLYKGVSPSSGYDYQRSILLEDFRLNTLYINITYSVRIK